MLYKNFAMLFAAVFILTSALCANQAEAQVVEAGLIGYWSFDANTIDGDTIKDVSGNGHDGTINFAVNIVEGKVGDALEFDGESGHYVDTGMMITEGTYESLTMMAWVKPNMPHEAWGSVINGDDGGWDRGYGYRAESWEIQVGQGGEWQPGETADINEWQHTVLIYTPTNVYFYKNNQKSEFGDRTVPTDSANTMIIGDDIPCGPNCSFPGTIDEVMVYSRALTDAEVEQNFNATGFAVDAAGKLALTWGAIKALR